MTSPEPMPESDPVAGGSHADVPHLADRRAARAPVVPLHDRHRVRASGPEDVLALIPYLLGFQPDESLVLVMLRDQRVVLTARIDLPREPDEFDHVLDHFSGVVISHEVEDCVAAVYSQDWTLAHVVLLALAGSPALPVVTALHCDDRLYRVLACDGDLHGPYGFDPRATAAAAEAVVAGLVPMPDRASLADRIAAGDHAVTDRVVAAAEDVELPDGQADRAKLMDRTITSCLQGLDGGGLLLSDADCALLGLLCLDLEVRDVAWLRMDRETAGDDLELWVEVARRLPPVLTAAPVCLAGMAAWIAGDGAFAWCCVDRAREEHPGYGLSELLNDILAAAVHPDLWDGMAEEMRSA